jgi:hypothetical protein
MILIDMFKKKYPGMNYYEYIYICIYILCIYILCIYIYIFNDINILIKIGNINT